MTLIKDHFEHQRTYLERMWELRTRLYQRYPERFRFTAHLSVSVPDFKYVSGAISYNYGADMYDIKEWPIGKVINLLIELDRRVRS